MKTIIRTNIKDNENVTVNETIVTVRNRLREKGTFLAVTRVDHSGRLTECLLSKSTIKMVKQQK